MEEDLLLDFAPEAEFQVLSSNGQKLCLFNAFCSSRADLVGFEADFPKGLSFVQLQSWLAGYIDLDDSFEDDVEGCGCIPSLKDDLVFLVLESVHVIADGVSLLGGQIFEDGYFIDVGFGNFIVIFDHFFLYFEEDVLGQTPEGALLGDFD